MYQYISGTLAFVGQNVCVIDNQGIGWQLFVSDKTAALLSRDKDKTVKAFTYLNVREDALELYGFATQEELGFFKLLIGVSGVGPKAALAILSVCGTEELTMCILSGDAKAISRAQGVGLKTAQKVILELKDKVSKNVSPGAFADPTSESVPKGEISEAVNALIVLGYEPRVAAQAVNQVAGNATGLQDIIRKALKVLSA